MNVILVCPECLPSFQVYQRKRPIALIPLFGRTLLDHALERLSRQGAREVLVIAVDRPGEIRGELHKATLWGMRVRCIPAKTGLSPAEAYLRFVHEFDEPADVKSLSLLDCLGPVRLENPSFPVSLIRNRKLASQLTMRERQPGAWISTRASVHRGAEIEGPCWIGPGVKIDSGARIGNGCVIEAGSVIRPNVYLSNSWVGPGTCVGEGAEIVDSIIWGRGAANCKSGRFLEIADAFLLRDLECRNGGRAVSLYGKAVAFLLLAITCPVFAGFALRCLVAKRPVFSRRRVVLHESAQRSRLIRSLADVGGLPARWPELFLVLKGEMALVGNRPPGIDGMAELNGVGGLNWFRLPVGVFSLADAEGLDGDNPVHALAYAAWFSAHPTRRLKIAVFSRCLARLFSLNSETRVPRPSHFHTKLNLQNR